MKPLFLLLGAGCFLAAPARTSSSVLDPSPVTDRSVYFETDAVGQELPILWGLDTAWPDEANMRRGVRFIGAENIGVARVSFQPLDFLTEPVLTERLENNLKERLRLVSYIGGPGKVQLVLNNDAPDIDLYQKYSNAASDPEALRAYCDLIYATTLSCQDKGWEVITASPLNEPDYVYNGQGSKEDFYAIAKKLKTEYPQYKDGKIRISGGNTLNCDQALPWYDFLFDYIDEGNTHQLAGDFDHYADFFDIVRYDGKYATADELHNVMEAMVGVEYGMQTGIWWGTAELTRGEFCKASFGRRLAYAENRKAWTAASVYRSPEGKIQGFVGTSERQALPSSYRFVSLDRDVFFNGHGPQREFVIATPGGEGYQQGQTNAEGMVDITWGEDVSPVINGDYKIVNKASNLMMGVNKTTNLTPICQYEKRDGVSYLWHIEPAKTDIGGDFSYHLFTLADHPNMKIDVLNWSLEEGADIILYDGGFQHNEQWFLKYAGDGYFRIFSHWSGLCLELFKNNSTNGVKVLQAAPSDNPGQLWRFLPADAELETEAPEAPSKLEAVGQSASVLLRWQSSASADVDGYVILRSDGKEFTTIARGITDTEYVDNTVARGSSYIYKVKAVDKSLNSSEFTTEVPVAVLDVNTMVGRWRFDGSLEDETENQLDAAAVSGMNVVFSDGHTEGTKSLRFSPDRYVQLPYTAANHEEITVALWVKHQARGERMSIFDFASDAQHGFSLGVGESGIVNLCIDNGEAQDRIDGVAVPAKEWTHVAVTLSRNRAALFVNGTLAGEGYGVKMSDIKPVLNYIGRDQDGSSGAFFNGFVQDLRIYNCVIPDEKMPDLMGDVNSAYSILLDSPVVEVEYYNALGIRIDHPQSGICLIRSIHTDGSVSVSKKFIR